MTGAMDHRGTPRGNQKGRLRPKIRLFARLPAFSLIAPPTANLSKYLTFRWLRNAFQWPDGGNRGTRRLNNGRMGTTDYRGTPRNTRKRGIAPSNPTFSTRFSDFALPIFAIPPLPRYLTFRRFRNACRWSEGRPRGSRRLDNGMGATDNRGTPWNTKGVDIAPKIHHFLRVFPLFLFSFPPFLPLPQYLTFRRFRDAWYWLADRI